MSRFRSALPVNQRLSRQILPTVTTKERENKLFQASHLICHPSRPAEPPFRVRAAHSPPAAGELCSIRSKVTGACTRREAVTALDLQQKQRHGGGKDPTDQPSEGLHRAADQAWKMAGGDSTHPRGTCPALVWPQLLGTSERFCGMTLTVPEATYREVLIEL